MDLKFRFSFLGVCPSRNDIIQVAQANGFEVVGFTTAEPFESHREFLKDRQREYGWAEQVGLELIKGTDPRAIMPGAQSIIVLMEVYFSEAYLPPYDGRPFRKVLLG